MFKKKNIIKSQRDLDKVDEKIPEKKVGSNRNISIK
jgi:hypothetical protein